MQFAIPETRHLLQHSVSAGNANTTTAAGSHCASIASTSTSTTPATAATLGLASRFARPNVLLGGSSCRFLIDFGAYDEILIQSFATYPS
jgi:hypothetical protein